MKTSSKGIELIKKFEGCKLKSYKCPAGVWTIGYGHTGSDVKENLSITEKEAENLLIKDLAKFEASVNSLRIPFNQNHFDAIVSFVYNVGFSAFKESTLFLRIKKELFHSDIASQFSRWNKSNGKVLPGLVKRREEEAKLYFETI